MATGGGTVKRAVAAAAVTGLMGVLILFSPLAREGAKIGLTLCGETVIPSLLPVLACGNILVLSDSRSVFERLLGGFTERVLRLPRAATAAILFGLICGYPAGALLTAAIHKQGCITETDAKRIMRFNFGGGAAFTVTAVGSGVYRSTAIGGVLLCISVLSGLFIAAADALFHRKDTGSRLSADLPTNSVLDALPQAVESTVRALAVMSAYIVLFCAFMNLAPLPDWLLPLLEITSGVCRSPLPLPYAAFFLNFGGICVHLQLLSPLKKMHVAYRTFLFGRLSAGVLSFAMATKMVCFI